jgi:predicted acyl esterase
MRSLHDSSSGADPSLRSIVVASSNFPHFDVNPNSGEAEGQAQHKRIANNNLHLSSRFASRQVLTIIPPGVLPA